MSYAELYKCCQTFNPKVRRNDIRDKVLALTGVNRVAVRKTTLDTTKCRGFYLSAANTDHIVVKQHGGHVIVLARELNYCWERFVFIKELMHMFDGAAEASDTGDKFEESLIELTAARSPKFSAQTTSEINCFWMALGALCPEASRIEYGKAIEAGRLDYYAIALQLRIPQLYVPYLFQPKYFETIKKLCA